MGPIGEFGFQALTHQCYSIVCIVLVTQLCPTLCKPMDYNPPGSLSMEFSRQEYWSGWPFPSPRELPKPGIKPRSPALQADSLLSEPQEVFTSVIKTFKEGEKRMKEKAWVVSSRNLDEGFFFFNIY